MPDPETCIRTLEILLPQTPVFNMAFRYNSGRALMMGVKRNGRQPLWMQRLKSAQMLEKVVREKEHPLIRETRRECMHELWDSEGLYQLLSDIRAGVVQVREFYTETPSPMSLPLQWAQEAAVMYDYAPTPAGIHAAVQDAIREEAEQGGKLVRPGREELSQLQDWQPENWRFLCGGWIIWRRRAEPCIWSRVCGLLRNRKKSICRHWEMIWGIVPQRHVCIL